MSLLHDDYEGRRPLTAEAQRVREAYIRCRSAFESARAGRPVSYNVPARYDGRHAALIDGEQPVGRGSKEVWTSLAEFVRQQGADFEPYVYAQFEGLGPADRPPEPPQLKSQRALDRWNLVRPSTSDSLRLSLTLQTQAAVGSLTRLVRRGLEELDAWLGVLNDPVTDLTPLFRYSMAVSLTQRDRRFSKLARYYLPQAQLQYRRNPQAYCEVWQDFLPDRSELRHSGDAT